jgi:hypothetical protein
MYELTQEQLSKVTGIVSNYEITYSHLPIDLVDHICCDIESEMSVGLSFNKALERVQCKFGDTGLQKVQEDTILLIDQKYRFMKTTMKIFGNVSLALVGIGTIFKIFHWPGATIALTLGFLLLGLVFYPSTILASYRKNGRKNIFLHILSILGGVALIFGILFKINHWPLASMLMSWGWGVLLLLFLPIWIIVHTMQSTNKKESRIYLIGVIGVILYGLSTLFKFQHWPGAYIMLILGAILIVSVFLPLYAINLSKKKEFVNERFIYLVFLISLFLIFGTLINLNLSKSIFKGLSNTDKYANVEAKYFKNSNEGILNNKNTELFQAYSPQSLNNKADSLSKVIQKLKRDLILSSGDINASEIDMYIENIDLIHDKDNWDMVDQILFGENDTGLGFQLKSGLKNYKEIILQASQNDPEVKKELDQLFELDDIPEYGFYKSWENRMFKYNLMYITLIQLSNIERNIRIAENLIYSNNYVTQETDMNKQLTNDSE